MKMKMMNEDDHCSFFINKFLWDDEPNKKQHLFHQCLFSIIIMGKEHCVLVSALNSEKQRVEKTNKNASL
jgi:hypothetical protein